MQLNPFLFKYEYADILCISALQLHDFSILLNHVYYCIHLSRGNKFHWLSFFLSKTSFAELTLENKMEDHRKIVGVRKDKHVMCM